MEMYMLLSGSKAEVYDIVLDSLYYEVSQSSNKKINKSSLKKGFKHTKHQKKGKHTVDYHYHLTELDPEKGYNLKVQTNSGTITMGMRFESEENVKFVTMRILRLRLKNMVSCLKYQIFSISVKSSAEQSACLRKSIR